MVIDSEDGTVSETTVAPSGTIQWSDLDSVPENATVTVLVSESSSNKDELVQVQEFMVDIAPENQSKNGSQGFSLGPLDITDESSLAWSESDFACDNYGESHTVSGVKVQLSAVLNGASVQTNATSFDTVVNYTGSDFVVDGTTETLSGEHNYGNIRVVNGGTLKVANYDGSSGGSSIFYREKSR